MTNKEIELKAVREVIKYEHDIRRKKAKAVKQGKGYDIISRGRCIEVKGTRKKNPRWVSFQHNCFEALQKEKSYFVYIVKILKAGQPEFYVIPRKDVIKHLRLKWSWELKLPVKEMQKWNILKQHKNRKKR
ncbi:MAG: DUF3883 domain-containing protein [candidate division Zixibacteria bacterium]|nr:DUF3883 domain-containing protein [candidate division Zixibacteria bacterium]